MQFYLKEKNQNNRVKVNSLLSSNQKSVWIIKISLISFLLSLLLSLFSEFFLTKSNIYLAMLLLTIFMILNIVSDMIGLAITSCQVVQLKLEKISTKELEKCMFLINNSDRVSTILCDVIGDVCGILCGVSGSIIAIILSKVSLLGSLGIMLGAVVSSLIVGLTVLFKAIAKNYAVRNSLKLVRVSARFLLKINNMKHKLRKRNN